MGKTNLVMVALTVEQWSEVWRALNSLSGDLRQRSRTLPTEALTARINRTDVLEKRILQAWQGETD